MAKIGVSTRVSAVILIPALNEEKTVGRVVREIRSAFGGDIVVIDDASTDGTVIEARRAGAAVLPLAIRLGAWGAIRTGLRYAHRRGYDVAVTMDADGQHPVESLNRMVAQLQEGPCDVLIGSCAQRGSLLRKMAWFFFQKLTMLDISDLTSGFRAYNKSAIACLIAAPTVLLDYQDIGVLLHLRKKGLGISERFVPMCTRENGKSRIFSSWFAVLRYLIITGVLSLSKI
ncbi:MAG: glycosyltransferase family 2 protein [Pseudomonadota bacterium]